MSAGVIYSGPDQPIEQEDLRMGVRCVGRMMVAALMVSPGLIAQPGIFEGHGDVGKRPGGRMSAGVIYSGPDQPIEQEDLRMGVRCVGRMMVAALMVSPGLIAHAS